MGIKEIIDEYILPIKLPKTTKQEDYPPNLYGTFNEVLLEQPKFEFNSEDMTDLTTYLKDNEFSSYQAIDVVSCIIKTHLLNSVASPSKEIYQKFLFNKDYNKITPSPIEKTYLKKNFNSFDQALNFLNDENDKNINLGEGDYKPFHIIGTPLNDLLFRKYEIKKHI